MYEFGHVSSRLSRVMYISRRGSRTAVVSLNDYALHLFFACTASIESKTTKSSSLITYTESDLSGSSKLLNWWSLRFIPSTANFPCCTNRRSGNTFYKEFHPRTITLKHWRTHRLGSVEIHFARATVLNDILRYFIQIVLVELQSRREVRSTPCLSMNDCAASNALSLSWYSR